MVMLSARTMPFLIMTISSLQVVALENEYISSERHEVSCLPFWRRIRKHTTEAAAQAHVIKSTSSRLVDKVEENAKDSRCSTHGELETIALHGSPRLFIFESVRDPH